VQDRSPKRDVIIQEAAGDIGRAADSLNALV
jgi:hypothetical protein